MGRRYGREWTLGLRGRDAEVESCCERCCGRGDAVIETLLCMKSRLGTIRESARLYIEQLIACVIVQ